MQRVRKNKEKKIIAFMHEVEDQLLVFAILGFHVFRSSLRNFANNKASSLIKVSIVCLPPILILGTSTVASKKALSCFSYNFLKPFQN